MKDYFASILILLSCLFFTCLLPAQSDLNRESAVTFGLAYGYQIPGADLADRFGSNFYLSTQVGFLNKKNWELSLDGGLLFGNKVKEDVLQTIRTVEGNIIGNDRNLADIQLKQRGYYLGVGLAKTLVLSESYPRSGLKVGLGTGFIQHKIRIQDDPVRSVPQLTEELKKGYDRLTNGWYLSQFVGYQYLANDRRINFYAGIETRQAFTKNRRSVNIDTGVIPDQNRLDTSWGLKVGWVLPFYLGFGEEIYY
jgi:hypothetical protein